MCAHDACDSLRVSLRPRNRCWHYAHSGGIHRSLGSYQALEDEKCGYKNRKAHGGERDRWRATLGVGAAIGAVYGAKLVQKFNPNVLKTLFGILFLYVSLKYIFIYFGVVI
jgi:hypothetical protein